MPGFGARVAERRRTLGLSQRQLAAACVALGSRVGFARVANIERENFRGGVTGPTIVALARALDCSADWLLGLSDEPHRE